MAADLVDDVNVQELAEMEAQYTVFVGSSHEDVSYAKTFWNSLALQPPIESRLVSADISQRLKVAKDPSIKTAPRSSAPKNDALFERVSEQRAEERQKYKDMAKRRDQIMVLLKKQREERIQHFFPQSLSTSGSGSHNRGGAPQGPPFSDRSYISGEKGDDKGHGKACRLREMISRPFKPKQCDQSNRHDADAYPQSLEEDIQHVRSLQ